MKLLLYETFTFTDCNNSRRIIHRFWSDAKAANKIVESAGWKTVRIEKRDVESLSLPAGITEKAESTKLINNGVPST